MRKFIYTLFVFVFLLGFFSCGEKENKNSISDYEKKQITDSLSSEMRRKDSIKKMNKFKLKYRSIESFGDLSKHLDEFDDIWKYLLPKDTAVVNKIDDLISALNDSQKKEKLINTNEVEVLETLLNFPKEDGLRETVLKLYTKYKKEIKVLKKKKSNGRCDWCSEWIQGKVVWASIYRNWENTSVKCCSNKCAAANERRSPIKRAKTKYF